MRHRGSTSESHAYSAPTYERLVTTSHQLMTATRHTWERCGDPLTWPCIAVCIDHGSDGWSGVRFLRHRLAKLLVTFDWNHRAWNNVRLAISDQCWQGICLLTILMVNFDHGPWCNHHETL